MKRRIRIKNNLKIGNMKKKERLLTVKQWFEMVKDKDLRERLLRSIKDNTKEPTLDCAIAYAFNWEETEEGSDYWDDVHRRAVHGEIELIGETPVKEEEKAALSYDEIKKTISFQVARLKKDDNTCIAFRLEVSEKELETIRSGFNPSVNKFTGNEAFYFDGHVFDLIKLPNYDQGEVNVYMKEANTDSNNEYDYINPDHYQGMSKEVWEMMVDIWGVEAFIKHCEMTAFKYRMRVGKKPDQPVERDLEKAKWYEDKVKELKSN